MGTMKHRLEHAIAAAKRANKQHGDGAQAAKALYWSPLFTTPLLMATMLFGGMVSACSATDSATNNDPEPTSTSSGNGGAGGQGGAASSTTTTTSVTVAVGSGGGGGGLDLIPEVYAHSADTLYKLDPLTKQITTVGKMTGCPSVFGIIDIAVDKNNNIVGVSGTALWSIDKNTAACTGIGVAASSFPNSLSYVPEGVLDPSNEVLVGYRGSQYVRIDPSNGQVTVVGNLGAALISSGDIVSVKDGGTYLTVRGTACTHDCLAEIDPKTGKLIKNWGDLGHDSLYGLAYWGGRAYGFSDGGELLEIKFDSQGVAAVPIPFPSKPPNLQFNGAGSSTVAPVMRPN